jgi:hypothetical protein
MNGAEVLAFTGSQRGASPAQREWLRRLLLQVNEVHHGACIGADAMLHALAVEMGVQVVVHPPTDLKKVAPECLEPRPGVIILPPEKYPVRNRAIVMAGHRLAACPHRTEYLRSGTWSTVRFARKVKRPVLICYPDGSTTP